MKRLNSFLDKHLIALLTLAALGLFVGMFIFYLSQGTTTLYGDSRSRLLIARRVFDSLTPGFTQLGAVWPPLPQILFLPTVWNNFFLYSGISGSLVSILSATLATYFLARMAHEISKSKFVATVTVLAFVLNPSFLYISTTPMTEPLFISMMIISTYFIWRWSKTNNIVYLPLAGIALIAVTLTRYDGWFLAVFSALIIPAITLLKRKSFSEIEGTFFLFSTVAFSGIVAWLIYNQLIYGNMLRFANGEGAAASAAIQTGTSALTRGDFIHSTLVYLSAASLNLSYVSLGVAFIAPFLILKTKKWQFLIPALILSTPILFNIISLFLGQSVLYTPQFKPFYFYNVRYGLLVLPLAALGYGIIADSLPNFFSSIRIKILIMVVLLLQITMLFTNKPKTLAEAEQWYYSPKGAEQQKLVSWLQTNKIGGFTLISTLANDTLLFDTRMPLKKIIYEGNGRFWQQATTQPQSIVQRIIVSPDVGDKVWKISLSNKHFFDGYKLDFSGTYFKVYDLQNTTNSPSYSVN